ncbi:MAG: hypothetical protein HY897_19035, partial [Deltaproteobacteria bacterium]|nr:hypothetical protein [Deltaproteobacteria bacterium]
MPDTIEKTRMNRDAGRRSGPGGRARTLSFEDDLSYLQEETMWVAARLRRLCSESEILGRRAAREYGPEEK